MSLSSKHITLYVHKHVSGAYFVPSTECDSGNGHIHTRRDTELAHERRLSQHFSEEYFSPV